MTLDESLKALAAEGPSHVSSRVDAAVMAAWDTSRQPPHRECARPRIQWSVWAVAGAIALAVIAMTAVWRAYGPAVDHVAIPSDTAVLAPAPAEVRLDDEGQSRMAPAPSILPAGRRVENVPRAVEPSPASDNPAYVLVPELGSGGPLTLMRVRMARREFSRLGVPISNPDGDGLVDVEVLVGEDGVARSIQRAVAVGWAGPNP